MIPFNKPSITGNELNYISQAIANGHLSGNGEFTKKCQHFFESKIGCYKALLTHSCTAALEMAAILANIQPGDEVIMPSYTFVSTANAFVLRGGIPVFVDIRPDTLNIDESKIEAAITPQTKAIIVVHYAGVSCEMDSIMDIAQRYQQIVIEDAAQGIASSYKNKPLGSMGDLATMSFHETKNVICGEGGALLINNPLLCDRAEIIWEKGTNRSQFFRGMVDKYTWVDIGSSYLPSEINAAFLWAQLEAAELITQKRKNIWQQYHQAFAELEFNGKLHRPFIPNECEHNAHIYYLLLPDLETRNFVIDYLKNFSIQAVFHYVPLHLSPAGKKYGRACKELPITDNVSDRLLRLPLWVDMTQEEIALVIKVVTDAVKV
ncbi:dTDP-4-amino-4,6-dideoxygalactose transaminase [Cronbergia sp. UHCC 0137]|uniref:dTDP-4-amino-4,6-dideoxygalactose transaminase n=1 Tax=Cronbergia sp. UHCC 0137 TaxID=3110239 RepID=UPI002B1F860F|nr:dTDP-4-amino-4,6-dideoxygalactose transaminase [Cronbergia sp. UHCC 0137]MEA5616576.1 dTDP-4-amino-4,6-dideoxygalactose transaminase [Cronbergia sp. UHCC 0137]